MSQLLTDLKTLFKTHWRILLVIVLIFWLSGNYTDVKRGIIDAWGGN